MVLSLRRRWLSLLTLTLTLTLTLILLLHTTPSLRLLLPTSPSSSSSPLPCGAADADLAAGRWSTAPLRRPLYDATCPFHRNAWNCLRNGRDRMDSIASWAWFPDRCGGAAVPRADPRGFLAAARGRRIGFVGDSLNENFMVALLCALRSADAGARKWKRKRAWRGGYFPKFDVTVAYHRAVLLANYTRQPMEHSTLPAEDGIRGIYKVDVDVAADDWVNITKFYDVLIFNTGHWWGPDKFPKETPLVFYREGKPIDPPLGIFDGLKVVLESMASYIDQEVPKQTLKLWRTQSPRHFYGGEWDHNGSCLFDEPLKDNELDSWFDPRNRGVNKEAREVNSLIRSALIGTDIQLFNLTYLSEFRADAHPAIWLGKKDAVAIWGQDCMHWCLPGLPDTWVDILVARIMHYFQQGKHRKN
ncbi:Protein trichome birefringence-like 12 [Ananas comosus]|uniref:Protein trichome birefringence-like 12 n=1 Tax=Ananas comosus TaxID=4615 RepID=A0A199VTF9_ANACO|nr:Protein trichome birefringence-like 12 [Ananas comosus]